jgi:hypothetical protein
MSKRDLLAGAVGAGLGAGLTYLLTSVRPPSDHASLIGNIRFTPPMPEAAVELIPVYVGAERFKSNRAMTPHTVYLAVETLPKSHPSQPGLLNPMAAVDIWTISDAGASPPRIYTVEIVKLERLAVNFTVFGKPYSIPETTSPTDTSGKASGYWLAQVKETGEIGEFL